MAQPQPRLRLPFSGAKLWEARERAGLSRPALARKCAEHGRPVSTQHLGRVESGNFKPSPELLKALAAALGVDVADLLDAEAA